MKIWAEIFGDNVHKLIIHYKFLKVYSMYLIWKLS